jgi:Flp pilus assembly protein TadB
MLVAQSVAAIWALVAAISCVLAAVFAWRASNSAKKLRSMISLQGELAEIRDYMAKIDAWCKRINSRETMTARRSAEASEREPQRSLRLASSNDKDELRRRAGLVAGKPVRHREPE